MAVDFNIDTSTEFAILDFTQTVQYYSEHLIAIHGAVFGTSVFTTSALRRPITTSQARRIEQFEVNDLNVGGGLTTVDSAWHLPGTDLIGNETLNYLEPWENFIFHDYLFVNDDLFTIKHYLLFAEIHVDRTKLVLVTRAQDPVQVNVSGPMALP